MGPASFKPYGALIVPWGRGSCRVSVPWPTPERRDKGTDHP